MVFIMNKKAKNILIFVLFLLILGGVMGASLLKGRVTLNPAGTVGNTAGNLNNGGLVCEEDGIVYFSNPYAGGSMYSMTTEESDFKKLNNVQSRNILAAGKYLYYFQMGASGETGIGNIRTMRSFNRCNKNGSGAISLVRDVVVTAQLVDNDVYILASGDTHPEFYKIKIDKSDKTVLADYSINPACAVNGTIYYNGTQDDHYLYALNTTTNVPSVVWRGNLWYPIVDGDYVYYMDVANNYRLCRYSSSQDIVEVLTQDRVDCYNIGSGYIYYQKNSETEPQLKCMRTDGSEVTVIAEGNYQNINLSSRYVYFQSFGNDATMFHMMIGSTQYSPFDAAKDAAMKDAE